MKKLTKKVVITTTAGLASMVLNAACGYGPPVDAPAYDDAGSTATTVTKDNYSEDSKEQDNSAAASESNSVEISIEASTTESPSEGVSFEEVPSDASSILDSLDGYLLDPDLKDNEIPIEVPAVYGPPTVDN